MFLDKHGVPDANPEVVIIGDPLDGSDNPEVAVGTGLSDITGVVVFQCVSFARLDYMIS